MSKLKITHGLSSSGSYVRIAYTKTHDLVVRPLITTRAGITRGGKPVEGKQGVNIWLRIHLQPKNRDEIKDIGNDQALEQSVPSARVAKGWGVPLSQKSYAGYWRNDAFLQVAYVGECSLGYLREKTLAGLEILIESLIERVTAAVWVEDVEDVVKELLTRIEPELDQYVAKKDVKNVPALQSTITLSLDSE